MGTRMRDFEDYARNLRRIFFAEFVEAKMREANGNGFRASLVTKPVEIIDSEDKSNEPPRPL